MQGHQADSTTPFEPGVGNGEARGCGSELHGRFGLVAAEDTLANSLEAVVHVWRQISRDETGGEAGHWVVAGGFEFGHREFE